MLRKLTIALAVASLGAVALAPSIASAKGGGMGGGMGGHGMGGHHRGFGGFGFVGVGGGYGYVDDGCYVTRPVLTRHGYRTRTIDVCSI